MVSMNWTSCKKKDSNMNYTVKLVGGICIIQFAELNSVVGFVHMRYTPALIY
jgi:hypothetical protein